MSVRTLAAVAVQTALAASIILFAPASAALASAERTFVSAIGSDSNTSSSCPLANPCRSFAAALTVTAAGGEIVAIDVAGYGDVTLTGPISITGAINAEVTVTAGATGITINAGGSDNIILENLTINCGGAANSTGVALNTGHLILQDSTVKLCTTGLLDNNSKADVVNSKILNNTTAVQANGAGFNPQGSNCGACAGVTEVRIAGGSVLNNGTFAVMNNPGITNNAAPSPNTNLVSVFTNSQVLSNIAGNATMFTITGTGSACSSQSAGGTTFNDCQGPSTYGFNANFNQQ